MWNYRWLHSPTFFAEKDEEPDIGYCTDTTI
jgi:hypothetical protein